MNSFRCSLRRDRRGGIEGLPLQLMIIILVATMGSAVIIGWMGNIETPHMIADVDVDQPYYTVTGGEIASLTVVAYDQDGNPLNGATVLLDGLGVLDSSSKPPVMQISEGKATFENLTVQMHGKTGQLHVSVSMSGYGENNSATALLVAA